VDVLENKDHIIESITSLILDLHLGGAVVRAGDVKLLDLFTSKGINSVFSAILKLIYLEVDDFVHELTIRVALGFSMQVDLVLGIVAEHQALEANTGVAGLRMATDHLCSNPVDIRIIMFIVLNLWDRLTELQTGMVLTHLLR